MSDEGGIPADAEVIDLTGLSDGSGSGEEEEDHESDSENGSSEEEIEIALNEHTRAQLRAAIDTVSETRLRNLLKVLVEADIQIEAALTKELVTVKRGTEDLVPRWETCANCDEEYDINTLRQNDECQFHPGNLEADYESFEDWDEDCHGPIDTSANRREYPENFSWTCCDGNGRTPGCLRREHRPVKPRKRKRTSL